MTVQWKQRELLRNPEAFATTLFLLVVDRFGLECLEWLPTSLALECRDVWQVDVPEENIGKIMAAINVATSDAFYTHVATFINVCNALYGYTDFTSFDPADSEEILMGVTEALLIWPPDSKDNVFSPEIQAYIKHVLQSDGNLKPIGILQSILGSEGIGSFGADFGDDPVMFSAVYDSQQTRHTALQASYYESVNELMTELGSLSLHNGETKEVIAQLERVISSTKG